MLPQLMFLKMLGKPADTRKATLLSADKESNSEKQRYWLFV